MGGLRFHAAHPHNLAYLHTGQCAHNREAVKRARSSRVRLPCTPSHRARSHPTGSPTPNTDTRASPAAWEGETSSSMCEPPTPFKVKANRVADDGPGTRPCLLLLGLRFITRRKYLCCSTEKQNSIGVSGIFRFLGKAERHRAGRSHRLQEQAARAAEGRPGQGLGPQTAAPVSAGPSLLRSPGDSGGSLSGSLPLGDRVSDTAGPGAPSCPTSPLEVMTEARRWVVSGKREKS